MNVSVRRVNANNSQIIDLSVLTLLNNCETQILDLLLSLEIIL